MATWQVQKAKTHFSELLNEAATKGPQIITRHGAETAVVISISEYKALAAAKPNFRDYLLDGPKVDAFYVDRDQDFGRDIEL